MDTRRSSRAARSLLLNRWPFDEIHLNEEVHVHEYGHQFWYGMVGINEFEEAWLDEGFNQYSTGRLVDRALRARDRPWAPSSASSRSPSTKCGRELASFAPSIDCDNPRGPTRQARIASTATTNRTCARDARAPARRADDGEHHAHVFGALAFQASLERRLLRRGLEVAGQDSDVVLQARGRDRRLRGLRSLERGLETARRRRRPAGRDDEAD